MRSYPMPTDPSASATLSLPLLPLRDVVLFPGIDTTLFLGRASTRRAAATAIGGDGRIAAVTQRSGQVETVTRADLHDIGVMASVKSMVRLPDGKLKVVVYGMQRIHVRGVSDGALYQELQADPVEELVTAVPGDSGELLEAVASQGPPLRAMLPDAIFASPPRLGNAGYVADKIAAHAPGLSPASRQQLLEVLDPWQRLRQSLAAVQASANAGVDLPEALEVVREWLERRVTGPGPEGAP